MLSLSSNDHTCDNVHMYDNKIEQVSSGSIFRSFSDSKANLSGSDRQKKTRMLTAFEKV